jgi:hypothetical protein
MERGEIITLTLKANIQSAVDEGLYKDLAWAKGNSKAGVVLAEALEGYVAENFVGTIVPVIEEEKDLKLI